MRWSVSTYTPFEEFFGATSSLPRMSRRPPLVFIFTVTMTGILNNTLLTPAIPDILGDFNRPDEMAGVLVAAGSVAGIAVAPVGGFLADRYGRRLILTVALAIFGLFGVVAAFAPTFEILILARLIQGAGSGSLVNLAIVLIGDYWTGAERTRLIGRNAAVLTIGLAAVPLLSGVITQWAGWRVTFGVYAAALVTAGAAWLLLDDGRRLHAPSVRAQFSGVLDALRRPILRTSIVTGFLIFVVIFGLFLTVLPVHLAQVFGMEAGARGLIIALPAFTATLASFNLGKVRARVSARQVVIFSALSLLVAFAVLGLTTTLFVAVFAVLIYGSAEGFFIPMMQDLTVSDAPDEHRAVIIATWVGSARVGQTVGPLLAGLSIGLFGTASTFLWGSLIAVLLVLIGLFGPFPRGVQEPLDSGRGV